MGELSGNDYRRILTLSAEIAEIACAAGRIESFLGQTNKLLECDVISLVAVTHLDNTYKTGAGFALGLDESAMMRNKEWYLDTEAYRTDPFLIEMRAKSGQAVRRRDIIADTDWYRDPHIEGLSSLGLDDVVGTVRPIGDQMVALVPRRARGASPFSERSREMLEAVCSGMHWYFLQLQAEGWFGPAPKPISPRLETVLGGLLEGLSEKELAERMFLSPRTIHKYVERIYDHFGAKSRGQLMALWVRYPHSEGLEKVSVFREK